MRNKTDIVFNKEDILKWQKTFRLLADWNISYEEEEPLYPDATYFLNGEICIGDEIAGIYPCPGNIDLDDYLLHELLYVAMKCVKDRKSEEIFVQDICKLISKNKNGAEMRIPAN